MPPTEITDSLALDWGLSLRLDTAAAPLRGLLPREVALAAPSPGSDRAVMTLSVARLRPGGGDPVPLVALGVAVAPDHGTQAAHLVLALASPDASARAAAAAWGFPVEEAPDLVLETTPDGSAGWLVDGAGPVLSFSPRLTGSLDPGAFHPITLSAQEVVGTPRGLCRLDRRLEGTALTDPEALAIALEDHPFLRGLVPTGKVVTCRDQVILSSRGPATLSLRGPAWVKDATDTETDTEADEA